ncbi:carboxylesterase/lipase family protein [Kitasatospora sp. NPDC017646]|uniref:carboxylesterase/lipase family protein n=1 Tax=Kitasatospora sp. NPDC017646 TaxID=3364024 RepID=UPI0037A5C2D0
MPAEGFEVVETGRGRVAGVAEGGALCFRGIPYAASPVGALRFAPPRPHAGWSGVREAAKAGPSVPQAASRLERVQGRRAPDWDEAGSLSVNVFTPRRAVRDGAGRAVLVWWHGGGFTSGSGGWDWYDGARLAALGDIVVVTANYRLGPLGYLHLPEIGAANLGFQDQVAVLRWVGDNIAAFGGDPGRVTVGGQSAGAYSSLMLALDAATGPLVAQVLLQSGPFGLAPQDPEEAAERAEDYLRLLGIALRADHLALLSAVPVGRLLEAYGALSARLAAPGKAAPPMYPVLGAPGLARTFQQAHAGGGLRGKPLLIGTTRDEATAFCGFNPRIQQLTEPEALDLLTAQVGPHAAPDLYRRHAAGPTPAEVFTAIQTDNLFVDGSLAIADRHAAGGDATYVYRFDHAPAEDPHRLGATHCAELPYLFGTFDAYPDSPVLVGADNRRSALSREFATALAQFVATGTAEGWSPHVPGAAGIRHFG